MSELRRKALEIIEQALREGRSKLLEHEALAVAELYGVPVAGYGLARNEDEAVEAAERIGYPVVLKIVSPDIVHKSDVGGVIVGLEKPEDVKKAYNEIIENVKRHAPNARIVGVLVQKMAPKGAVEVIVGGLRDPVFGPTIMFGLGGIFVEVFRDVSFRVAPFTERDAEEMINEIKASKILKGYRNLPPRDIKALIKVIMAAQKLMVENPEIRELDLNPVLSYPDSAITVDARIIVGREEHSEEHH
ncbi:acetate--CoA ligase family protein [Hyperthermus butylicus]|uniref:Acyl-CoA synthetase (NDP forming) n=1 Tax=Hyperthermus butylicus (strain DSM 5456 / JCM 9403 / PLM1-5) TaxID=415426 RepID=A2BJ63_HYPBU|nr:acetate--CoA ligase family protein [Hyperthermus butylicus]ABM80024.1 Acyl-CoA synthetase (NDP forming) [Hyperthermus butylicus DSM 5456]